MKKITFGLSLSIIIPSLASAAFPTTPPEGFLMKCHNQHCIATGTARDPDQATYPNFHVTYISNDNKLTWKIFPTDDSRGDWDDFGEWQHLFCNENLQKCFITGWEHYSTIAFTRLKSTIDGGQSWKNVNPETMYAGCASLSDNSISFGDIAVSASFRNSVILGTCNLTNDFFKYTSFAVYSANGGESWSLSQIHGPVPEDIGSLSCDSEVNNCKTSTGFITHDGGKNWYLK